MRADALPETEWGRRTRRLAAVLALVWSLAVRASPADTTPAAQLAGRPGADVGRSVRAVVLGTAQDAGIPQIADHCPRCEAARRDPARRRSSSSVALIDGQAGQVFLLDASPEIGRQLE